MIEIKTGSHYTNKKHNEEQFDKINNLLSSKKNPLYNIFDREQYYLDDCDGLISIIKSSYLNKDLTDKQLMKLKEYLKKHVQYEGFLYVGSAILRF